ncbi:MAG: agmatinase [Acidobacteria bacterium]|nr:agmatinase [Acidobacteriota bacterium]
MTLPFSYDRLDRAAFGGLKPDERDYDAARVVILPIPLDRTTSYVSGTRHAPREILVASAHMELWDEEARADVHGVGLYTLPEMELPFGELEPVMAEIRRVAGAILDGGKFLVALGGEHSITAPIVAAAAERDGRLSVLQIDAHADLRDTYMGTPHNHACAMRRVLEHAPCVQVGIRSLSVEEAEIAPQLSTRIFYDFDMRRDPAWIDRVVESLGESVYITIDCDGFDPAIMPAVGTPEPGGLSWREMTTLVGAVIERRRVVACDLVELSPIPGMIAPNFLCARLIYKILTYRFKSPGRPLTVDRVAG